MSVHHPLEVDKVREKENETQISDVGDHPLLEIKIEMIIITTRLVDEATRSLQTTTKR